MAKDNRPVYRRIDGKLVRIPGDKRDPKRRYRGVADKDGGYHVEFTDEEERERDEEEARWEAERPQREAESRRQQEEAERFRESLVYENRLVAFLDILGWGKAINRSIADPKVTQQLGITLQGLLTHVDFIEKMRDMNRPQPTEGDPQITHFSDNVVLSVTADQSGLSMFEFHLRAIVIGIMHSGYLVRGGVAAGKLIHRNNLVYGPALLRAYELEQKAKMPRILLDDPLAIGMGEGMPVIDKEGSTIGNVSSWMTDKMDGEKFFNFLVSMPVFPGNNPFKGWLQYIREMLEKRLKDYAACPKIHQKYVWVAERFNEVLVEYPDLGLDELEIH